MRVGDFVWMGSGSLGVASGTMATSRVQANGTIISSTLENGGYREDSTSWSGC